MKALVLGATGLVGGHLLEMLLANEKFSKIETWSRSELNISNSKLKQVVYSFEKNVPYPVFKDIDVVFCCLGTTIKKAGSKEAFIRVDQEIPLEVAQLAKQNGCESYLIVTAMGANASSMVFYNQVKGKVEDSLANFNFGQLGIFRPSMLLGDRKEQRTMESVGQKVMLFFDFLTPKNYKAITATKVAKAMMAFSISDKKGLNVIASGTMY